MLYRCWHCPSRPRRILINGKVTAFGNGLMVIRKLFGSAFAGDDLTNKAISADATRDTDEIHDYISAMTTVDPIG